ncbi:MAG: YHS domain-containing protein [Rhodospirillaceae bacterium]|nr:MAG: YHS domain-containing protein [Rhodospirillaceae bacterium]
MTVSADSRSHPLEVDGETYYFCGPGCNRAFQKEPEAYLSGDKKIEM